MIADLVLVIHAGVVVFNAGGLVAIAVGGWLGWGWVRNRAFRWLHLGALGFISVEALLGITCPLTRLEDWLRGESSASGFVARWLSRWMYWDLPAWVFGVVYVGVFLCAVLLWFMVPPRDSKK